MQPFILNATDTTPTIVFDPAKNNFEITGESRPENTRAYYEPVFSWIKKYAASLTDVKNMPPIILLVQLDYFSSTSAKYIANLLTQFEAVIKRGRQVQVLWRYRKEDTQIKESGEQFQKILAIPFVFESFED